jgi:hypothetical protein
LIVDDEPQIINSLMRELHAEKYRILTSSSAELAGLEKSFHDCTANVFRTD